MTWEVVIGLEIHAQLNTKSKIFSASSTAYGAAPNSQASLLDLGMPGQLPVLNQAVIPKAIKLGLAIGAKIGKRSVFDRKNYFYPDSPKGYQTSQFTYPIVDTGGIVEIEIDGEIKKIGVTRAHLEEDAGKSIHGFVMGSSAIDLNRAGTPLLEIVSEPDLSSAKEAVAYAKKMHELVQYLDICDGNMQEGSFRVDSNVSLHKAGTPLGTRTELKNINSFKFIEQAIEVEIARQTELLEAGHSITQETRLYDSDKNETRSMRKKEEANDYRYFPCPDLLPIVITDEDIAAIQKTMPELGETKRNRYVKEFKLSDYDANYLTSDRKMAQYFEDLLSLTKDAKLSANWVMGDLSKALNKDNISIENSPVTPELLAGLLIRLADNTISSKMAKQVFQAIWQGDGDADSVIESQGLRQITDDSAIEALVQNVLNDNPQQVDAFKNGQTKMLGFFVGQVMKASKGQANPSTVNKILGSKLNS